MEAAQAARGSQVWPRRRLAAAYLAATVVAVAAYQVATWWCSPERVLGRFVVAVNARDYGAMLSLADAAEVRELVLTRERLEVMMEGCLRWSPPQALLVPATRMPHSPAQSRYNRGLYLSLSGPDGRRVMAADGQAASSQVLAYNTDNGWKVGLSRFMHDVLVAADGRIPGAATRWRYDALCRQAGIGVNILAPETLQWLTPQGPAAGANSPSFAARRTPDRPPGPAEGP